MRKEKAVMLGVLALVSIALLATLWCETQTAPSQHAWRYSRIDNVPTGVAKDAMSLMKDWAVWMAGLQTAVLAALGALVKDGKIHDSQRIPAILAALFNGLALLFTAWTISALPSLMVRMYPSCEGDKWKQPGARCDFYEFPYNGLPDAPAFAYFSTWQHWFWGFGLVAFFWFILAGLTTGPKPDKPSQLRVSAIVTTSDGQSASITGTGSSG